MSDNWLIINRHDLKLRRYAEWLGESARVTVVAPRKVVAAADFDDLAKYHDVVIVSDFDDNSAVILACLEAARRDRPDKVIGIAEFDLLRAAYVREMLGIPGQSVQSAIAYRDKVEMKRYLRAAHIPVADCTAVSTTADLLRFYEATGSPIVLKPRSGGGSADVSIIHSFDDLRRVAEATPGLATDAPGWLIAERKIDHELLHVDGLVIGGEARVVWPSIHGGAGCLSHLTGDPLVSAMLDPDDEDWAPAVDVVRRALRALPSPDVHLFHAEVFKTKDGYLLNEVGCRLGGAQVGPTLAAAFPLDLVEAYIRALAGQPVTLPTAPRWVGGWATVPPAVGTITGLPDGFCPVRSVRHQHVHCSVGDVMGPAGVSTDAVASFVVTGDSRRNVESDLAACLEWFAKRYEVAV